MSDQEARRLDHVRIAQAGGLQDSPRFRSARSVCSATPAHELAGRRVQTQLARAEDVGAGIDGLAVGPDGAGGAGVAIRVASCLRAPSSGCAGGGDEAARTGPADRRRDPAGLRRTPRSGEG